MYLQTSLLSKPLQSQHQTRKLKQPIVCGVISLYAMGFLNICTVTKGLTLNHTSSKNFAKSWVFTKYIPHPTTGNTVDCFNRTLLNMFGTLENKGKSQWHSYSKLSVHPYNCTKNDVTGFSSYELMCGCQTRLSVLVHAVCLRGRYKLAEWESDVYVAVKQDRDLPIYTIKPENKEASWRTVHQVLLLPCGFITPTGEKPVTTKFKHKPITRLSAK